ncbi:MAG TPA: DUF1801 domain-containing protein [Clostridia bacterium]|nr:DUF1801 domain-containing protein [Clostridia bacterium]
MDKKQEYQSVDEYILSFPEEIQKKLTDIRMAIQELVPQAKERISYQMPSFYLNGNLVYYAAFSKHIGFYPTSSGIEAFKDELSQYKFSKGSVQFPLNMPLPIGLIKRITKFRVEENSKMTKA